MSDEENKKSWLPFGLDHLITGSSAAGVAVAGSVGLSHYKVDELTQQIQQLQPILVAQTRVIERQDATIKGLQEIRTRMDEFEKIQVQLVQTADQAKSNAARLDSVDRRLDREEQRRDREEQRRFDRTEPK